MSNGYKPKQYELVCQVCGRTYHNKRPNSKYCSKACCGKANRRKDIACAYCGKMFWPHRNEQRFCSNTCAGAAARTRITCACETCGKEIQVIPANMKTRKHHFCSKECAKKHLVEEMTGRMRNNGFCEHSGYTFIYQQKKVYRGQHRLVMEQYLGRPLRSDEIVHHKDGNKRNNDISNLEIVTRAEHINIHRTELHKARGIAEWKGVKEK